MRTVLALCFVLFLGTSLAAQGGYNVTVPGAGTYQIYLGTDADGNKVVYLNEVEQAGWKWDVVDADGDGKEDDIRIWDHGDGIADLKDGAGAASGDSGTVHDGNVAYPNNQVGTWSKQ